jgi:transglutaminase-like putative cysteine protease
MGAGMENGNGALLVYRLSFVAGITGILLALFRLERLLRGSVEGLPWEVIMVAAGVLGATITWAGLAYRLSTRVVVVVNLVGMFLALVRITVPGTTWFVFPTASSFGELATELEYAREVIRAGVAPVIPLSGIVAIVALVFWALGAILAWSMLRRRPYAGVLAPLVVYLQFATMDRVPGGWWAWWFLGVLGFALIAVALDRRREGTGMLTSGLTRTAVSRTVPAVTAGVLAVVFPVALWLTSAAADLVPRSGFLEWRATSGLTGEYYGSVSYNPFVGIQQSLVSQSNVPVFVAGVEGDLAADEVYWRLLTLDTFNGRRWFADGPRVAYPEDRAAYENADQRFRGETAEITQYVTVLALQMDWLPAAYSPTEMTSETRAVERGFRVKADDASLRFDALSYRGMTYQVVSEVPLPDLDVLSLGEDGLPSPVFAGAAEEGEYTEPETGGDPPPAFSLDDRERYLTLPEGIDDDVADLARVQTRGLETDFERALALEAFFRSPGNFRYSSDIEPGLEAADLSAWLLEPDSPSYRTGYCEQFATSLATMARMLDIPSRVVLGFTPGQLLDDGRVVVRDRNAHAWVELWMPSQGWVRFDPTPRGDGANPPATADLPFDVSAYLEIPGPDSPLFDPAPPADIEPFLDEDLLDIPPAEAFDTQETGEGPLLAVPGWVIPVALGLAALIGLLPALKWARRKRRLRRLRTGDISAAWEEIVDRLIDLGAGPEPAATPAEFAAATDPAMAPLADAYGRTVYGPTTRELRERLAGVAAGSLAETEDRIVGRFSMGTRISAWYRPGTLAPQWWRRLRRRFEG